MPVQFQNAKFSVGSNDAAAQDRYRARFDHSMGKCRGTTGGCPYCEKPKSARRQASEDSRNRR